jgi:transposase
VPETGIDMARYGTATRLAAWAGVAPGNDESAGKQRSGRTRPGNQPLRTVLTPKPHLTVSPHVLRHTLLPKAADEKGGTTPMYDRWTG